MSHTAPHYDRFSSNEKFSPELSRLEKAIEHAGHFLPSQGPITVFIHHNTLHAFEELPFHEGIVKGGRIFGCQPYLSEDRFRQELQRGRIQQHDIDEVLRRDLGSSAERRVPGGATVLELRRAMLQFPLKTGPGPELHWCIAETDALERFHGDIPPQARQRFVEETRHWVLRDVLDGAGDGEPLLPVDRRPQRALADLIERYGAKRAEQWSDATWEAFTLQALWRICCNGVHASKATPREDAVPLRHRDYLLAATGEDSDQLVHTLLIRFCGAFLDQGFAPWTLPERNRGFLPCFCALFGQRGGSPDTWQRGLAAELRRIEQQRVTPLELIHESLHELGVEEESWETFLTATLLGLRGWAGMIRQIELRADRAAVPAPAGSVSEFLAIYLLLERFALRYLAHRSLHFRGPLAALREAARAATVSHDATAPQRAYTLFQLAQVLGWLPADLYRLTKSDWKTLLGEIDSFHDLERRRIFQQAFERRYYTQSLDAITLAASRPLSRPTRPSFQIVTCLDDREESFRRHVEEICPSATTLGAAGFFNVPMYYRGAADANFVPLCPVVIVPQHWVEEDVAFSQEEAHRRRTVTRRAIGAASHQVHLRSRTVAGGAVLATGFGVLATLPLMTRVLLPRLAARIRRAASKLVQPPPQTTLLLERVAEQAERKERALGFHVNEMIDIAERLLREVGMTRGLSKIVILIGHGSQSLNNPHNSAYMCGACGGSAGGPNARAAARILNDARVREALRERGLEVPDDTTFVGAYHNTCDDSVTYFDLDSIPKTNREAFSHAQEVLEEACRRNAHERCRRFVSAPLNLSFVAAKKHVESRAEDLAQTRPECGHATNVLCIVGRRDRTRGLFMDRRAFLTSYDPAQDDPQHSILERVLSAVVPVCAGINLEYYFSYVDSTGWGCGTKLPHNVASLLGVMDGPASDLRAGLPWQMVEIHEPLRLLMIVETTPAALLDIMERNAAIGRVCRNGWIQVATLDPESSRINVFRKGRFEPYIPEVTKIPTLQTSVDWYRGWRDHLGFARIRDAFPQDERADIDESPETRESLQHATVSPNTYLRGLGTSLDRAWVSR